MRKLQRRFSTSAQLDCATKPVDIGFGDVVIPEPATIIFPTSFEFPAPELRAYRPETVVAEKLCAIVALDLDNSRMKDYFDLWSLGQKHTFDGGQLAAAIKATFERRKVTVPAVAPAGLTSAFSIYSDRQTQWRAFANRALSASHRDLGLSETVAFIAGFLLPVIESIHESDDFRASWQPGGPWHSLPPGATGVAPFP